MPDHRQELLGRIEKLSNDQRRAIQDARRLGMTLKVAKECRDRREAISKLVDKLVDCEKRGGPISELLNRLAGLDD